MKPRKLIWQIYPANLLALLVVMAAIIWYGSVVFQEFYLHQAELDLEARANLIKSRVDDYIKDSNYIDLREFCKESGREAETRITIIDKEGVVLADSNENPSVMDNHGGRPEIAMAGRGQRGKSLRFSKTLGEKMLYIAIPLKLTAGVDQTAEKAGEVNTVIRMSVPVTSLDQTIRRLQLRIGLGCILIVLAAALITLVISRNISRPLEEMTRSAERFSKGDFSQRMLPLLQRTSSLEVTALATSMDRMAELLDEKIGAIVTHRNQLEAVFSSMVESVIALDRQERVISVNTAAANLLGVKRKEVQGKYFQEIIRNIPLQEQVKHILTTRESVEDEIVLQDESGDKYLQTSVVNLFDGTGESVGVLIVLNDVTNLRRLERIRRDFVANVSHELRTPITSIRGYVETLLDGALDSREDSVRFLEIVLRQSDRLNVIIDDLLSLSRIEQESGDGEICKQEGPLCAVLEAAVQTCELNAMQQGVAIELECPDNISMLMNETLLEQAVVNLLINAVKYSKPGDTVLIQTAIVKEGNEKKVQISVKDQGCGIAKEHLSRLFERFYRSDTARSREFGGTGLGLAIVKHIVQAHGGTVEVKSVEGRGSEFALTFPGTVN